MNDFTKEELIMLRRSIQETIIKNDPWENPCLLSMHRTLREKLQFMIDNYCEHKKDVWPTYTCSGDLPISGFCYECGSAVDKRFIAD